MTIVAVDGVDIDPLTVDRQRIAIAETYDVIITLPDDKAYEFRATSEDGTGYASAIIGTGQLIHAADMPKPNPFLVDHAMHGEGHSSMASEGMDHAEMDHSQMDHAAMGHDMGAGNTSPKRMAEYELLRSVEPTNYASNKPVRDITLELTGDMERYAWSFNNKVLSEASKILIRKGEVVRFVLENKTMMHHPLHLHGHFFRVLNGQGIYSPLKHTVNVPPLQTVTIEFLANEEKDWFFHCHNLYHMKSGMTRVVSYEGSTTSTKKSLAPLFSDRHWFYFADIGTQSNFTSGEFRAENTRNAFELEYDWNYKNTYEVELVYERYINRFLELYAGVEIEQEIELGGKQQSTTAIIGAHYLLPLMIDLDVRIDSNGRARLGFASELQLTDRVAFDWDVNTDGEFRLQLKYEINKRFSVTGGTDDQYDWGLGVKLAF